VKKIPGLAGRVRVGAPDVSLTPASGVVAVAELVGRLGVSAALDDAIGEIKQRDRGLSAGEFLVAVAQAQMFGAQFWTGLDRRRADLAGEALSAVATPASTTAVELAQRFGPARLAGIEEGIGEIVGRVLGLLPATRGRCCAPVGPPSIWTAPTSSATGRPRTGSPTTTKDSVRGVPTWLRGPRPAR
jgi:hypothetical protein